MIQLRKVGSFFPLDPEGYLLNVCAPQKISSPWMEAVEELKRVYLKNIGEKMHSLYLRGSVPRGEAKVGFSDVDSFALVLEQEKIAESWIPEAQIKLKRAFPFAKYFELNLVPMEKVLNDFHYFSYRFLIKILSLCIHGEDLAPRLPKFRPSLQLAFMFHGNILEVLDKGAMEIQRASDREMVGYWCHWLMKRLIRTGFGIVMEQAEKFTRDLYLCYQVFSEYYPLKEPEMKQALEFAINPPKDKKLVLDFINKFGPWLVDECRRVFLKGK